MSFDTSFDPKDDVSFTFSSIGCALHVILSSINSVSLQQYKSSIDRNYPVRNVRDNLCIII